jgi:hypothetical protein
MSCFCLCAGAHRVIELDLKMESTHFQRWDRWIHQNQHGYCGLVVRERVILGLMEGNTLLLPQVEIGSAACSMNGSPCRSGDESTWRNKLTSVQWPHPRRRRQQPRRRWRVRGGGVECGSGGGGIRSRGSVAPARGCAFFLAVHSLFSGTYTFLGLLGLISTAESESFVDFILVPSHEQ